jgi:hypothetical protein
MDDPKRRQFLGVLGLTALVGASSGTVAAQEQQTEPHGFRAAPLWYGTSEERPEPGSSFFDNKSGEVLYLTEAGQLSHLAIGDSEWSELPVHLAGYATPDLPTDVPTGSILFDENRSTPAWWDTDHYEYPNFVDDVLTESVTVADTTTRTVVFDPDINANSLVKGRKYQIDLSGSFSTANNSDVFTIDVNLAGATDVAGIGNVGGNVTNAPWNIEFAFTVREHGVNGVLQPHTKGLFDSEPADSDHGTVTVDTTTVTELSVDIQWSSADPANSVTVKQAHLKQMG